ncbi:GSCOCG00012218001-RA-CDS [Cotesia congregata]|nr:GSCOCG00012218001-RA-CDS [Cotesia congregata]
MSQNSNVSNFETDFLTAKRTPKINIMTPELAAALDRGNVSSRSATYVLAATLKSVGFDTRNVNLSYKTIQRQRIIHRKEIAKGLKEDLKFNDNYVVHWDGKLLSDIVGTETVDRLPVLLTSSGSEQLLGIPKINSGSGIEQALAVYSTMEQWGVSNYIKAICFDTAATNTGIHHGAGVELEKILKRKLIWLPCRHHVIELVIKGVFEAYWPVQSGPNVPFFNRFKIGWNKINTSKYNAGINDKIVADILLDKKDELLSFIDNYSQKFLPRNDYREFLELSSIFLGATPKDNYTFKCPGAMSHARWMSKAIYCLKIFIFRTEFKITAKELNNLRQICIFIVTTYIKAWFTSSSAILAPNNDLTLMQQLILYTKINSTVSQAALKKMVRHLWYLSDQLAIMSLFDDSIDLTVKKKMIENLMNNKSSNTKTRKYEVVSDSDELLEKDISDFISVESLTIFKEFDLPYDFIDEDISNWSNNDSFQECKEFFGKLAVVNDVAERGVSLIEDYNKCLTKNLA